MAPKAQPKAAAPAPKAAAPAAKKAEPKAAAAAPAPKKAAEPAPKKAAAPAPAAQPAAAPKTQKVTGAGNGVYVKHWPHDSCDVARSMFQGCGKVIAVRVRRGKFAIVWFDNAAAVKKAVDTFDNKTVKGNKLSVAPAKASPPAPITDAATSIFVSPIFRSTTSRKQLSEKFAAFGKVTKIRTYRHNFGFVYFDSNASAQKAVKEMNGKPIANRKVLVKLSRRSKDKDRKRAEDSKRAVELRHFKAMQHH